MHAGSLVEGFRSEKEDMIRLVPAAAATIARTILQHSRVLTAGSGAAHQG